MLCPTSQQLQECLQKLCSISLVQFLTSAMAPVTALSGGLVPSLCPGPLDPNPSDLLKPADSAEGAASRIKKKEAEAKARRAAVRYLGTVDCRRYPEAELALVASLRGDENECVRLEAAWQLAGGCCCTRKVLEALVLTVSGRKSNEPAETSPRVRMAAALALERCLKRYCEIETQATRPRPVEPPLGAPPPVPPGAPPVPPPVANAPRLQPDPLLEDARQVLARYKAERAPRPAAPVPERAATPPPPLAITSPEMDRESAATAKLQQTVARIAEQTQPPTVVTAAPEPTEQLVPPTGKRDMWNVLRQAMRVR
jgi:hypothetical protein